MADGGRPPGTGNEPRPLVGRDTELRHLRNALREAATGSTQAVLISGDAGLGKTAIIRTLEPDAHAAGVATAWGHCWESIDTPPFWTWSQALLALHPDPDWSDVAPWVAAELQPLAAGDPLHAEIDDRDTPNHPRFVLFRAVSAFLRQMSQRQPLMVVIEDLHSADESSLLLFRSLVEEHRSEPILLIGTFDAMAAGRRVRHLALIDDIGRKAQTLRLAPLSAEEVASLFAAVSAAPVSAPVLSAVYEATEGNPFFVEEAVRLLESKGTLNRPDYSRGFRVPQGARGLIRARLMSLPEEGQEILSVAAVLGREFSANVLAEVVEIPRETVLDLLHDPVAAGVIDESGIGTYRFTHVLLRETAYEDLKAGKRMRLHARVADVLEKLYIDDEMNHAQELAHHWFKAAQAGDPTKTILFAEAAAEQALAQHAYEEAERLYQRALKASESIKGSREVRERLKKAVDDARELGSDAVPQHVDVRPPTEAMLKKDGDVWRVQFDGQNTLLKDSKGLSYVAKLLANAGRELHSLELTGSGGASPRRRAFGDTAELGSDPFGDLGPILDEEAKTAYKRRIRDLEEEEEEAARNNDPERATRASEERAALIQQIAAAVGLGGRNRRVGSAEERARVSVTRNVKDALRRIAEAAPSLGDHLHATIRTGTYCSYTPDPRLPIRWTT